MLEQEALIRSLEEEIEVLEDDKINLMMKISMLEVTIYNFRKELEQKISTVKDKEYVRNYYEPFTFTSPIWSGTIPNEIPLDPRFIGGGSQDDSTS